MEFAEPSILNIPENYREVTEDFLLQKHNIIRFDF